MAARWEELPEHVKTDAQALGRHGVGCEGTHGVFPRCNFACSPCYHSKDANKVRVDGPHTLREVEEQMAFLEKTRGPRAHAQLIGGEVTLLPPADHGEALRIMRRHGREPMSLSHGDFDYEYLRDVVIDEQGNKRVPRISFAGHFDTTMRGRRGIRIPENEADLNPYRKQFCDLFARLRKEHGVRSFLAHNMTVTPSNVHSIPQLIADCRTMGFNMFSFQPAAFIGNERRWKESYRDLEPDFIWSKIEEGAGARLPYKVIQVGDLRCNRTAWGFYVGDQWHSILDDNDPEDLHARDVFLRDVGGVHFNAPLPLLALRLLRLGIQKPHLVPLSIGWVGRTIRRVGGLRTLLRHKVTPMTFVMHRFMDADSVNEAWSLLEAGQTAEEPAILEVQERLRACSYAMAHPETGRVVPACVQHGVYDPQENEVLTELLPLPTTRPKRAAAEAS
jgi:MoaA/NifB/PqqE/SkfB family radical SAM enzyme